MTDDPRYWDYPDFTEYTLEELIKAKEECEIKIIQLNKKYEDIPIGGIGKHHTWKQYCHQIYIGMFIKEELQKKNIFITQNATSDTSSKDENSREIEE